MARKKFEARNPLTETPRETVVPTPLRPRPADDPSAVSQHAGMPADQQEGKQAPKPQPSSGDKQYTTYLRATSIKAIKRYAFDQEIPATEVMQTAVDEYLKSRGSPTDV